MCEIHSEVLIREWICLQHDSFSIFRWLMLWPKVILYGTHKGLISLHWTCLREGLGQQGSVRTTILVFAKSKDIICLALINIGRNSQRKGICNSPASFSFKLASIPNLLLLNLFIKSASNLSSHDCVFVPNWRSQRRSLHSSRKKNQKTKTVVSSVFIRPFTCKFSINITVLSFLLNQCLFWRWTCKQFSQILKRNKMKATGF